MILIIIVLGATAYGQNAFYSIYSYDSFIPKVTIDHQTEQLQKSILPDIYKFRQARTDINWLVQNDSSLSAFWAEQGDTVLHIMTELSGIEWNEQEFDIYFVRYYPTIGSHSPLIIPIGGYNNGSFTTAAAEGNRQKFNLLYQLAGRMLDQAQRSNDPADSYIARHPLMRPGAYRHDNLAMLLALSTAYSVLGFDSTEDAYSSTFWKQNHPGRTIFEKYFKDSWLLTPERTLSDWLIEEPYNSHLVNATRPPRIQKEDNHQITRKFIEDLPLKGQIGLAVKLNSSNQLEVTNVDMYRAAYAAGIREGDVIRRVNGKLVRNHKTMVEYILETLETDGAMIEIGREGMVIEMLMTPMVYDPLLDDSNNPDSVSDSLPPAEEIFEYR